MLKEIIEESNMIQSKTKKPDSVIFKSVEIFASNTNEFIDYLFKSV